MDELNKHGEGPERATLSRRGFLGMAAAATTAVLPATCSMWPSSAPAWRA